MNPTGEWKGYFTLPGIDHEFPIRAKFEFIGSTFTGSMVDEGSNWTESIEEIMTKMSPRESEYQKWKSFAEENPHSTVSRSLPTNSKLQGSVRGRLVRFTKIYDGPERVVWTGPTFPPITQDQPTHPTEYVGTLDEGGTQIKGNWIISRIRFLGLWRSELNSGGFLLSRSN